MCMICKDYNLGLLTNTEALKNAFEAVYPSEHFQEILQLLSEGPEAPEDDEES